MSTTPGEHWPEDTNVRDTADVIVPITDVSIFSSGIRRKVKERHAVRFHESAKRIGSGLRAMNILYRLVRFPAILHVTQREFAACAPSLQERTRIISDIYYGQNGNNRILGALHHMQLECAGIVVTPPSAVGAMPCRFMVALAAPGLHTVRAQHEEIRRRVYGDAIAPDMPIGITLAEATMSESQFYERQSALRAIAADAEPVPRPFVAKMQGIEYKP